MKFRSSVDFGMKLSSSIDFGIQFRSSADPGIRLRSSADVGTKLRSSADLGITVQVSLLTPVLDFGRRYRGLMGEVDVHCRGQDVGSVSARTSARYQGRTSYKSV